jgi:predicted DCC family thiol-disulfide oxidoreductase YuxK
MTKTDSAVTLLHDRPCLLCRASVQWVIRHDLEQRFRFVGLDSNEGRELLLDAGLEPQNANSVVLIRDGRAYRYSSALVVALRQLGGRWSLLGSLLWLVPKPIRDAGYRVVARHRHLWPFGGECELSASGSLARQMASEVSTATRSMRSIRDPAIRMVSGEASRSSSPAMESAITTGRADSE